MKHFLVLALLITGALAQNTAKYPASVATDADLGIASNRAETTLTVGITSTATSLPVLSGTPFKPGMFASIDNEFVAVCAASGNTITVGKSSCPNVDGRGLDTANGSSGAVGHLAGARVAARISAWHHNQVAAEVIALEKRLDGTWINVREKGAKGDGTTDDSAAVLEAIQAVYDAGGGTVYFPPGTYRMNSQLAIPNDGGGIPKQPTITLRGEGQAWDGTWTDSTTPTSALDLRYSGAVAKIDTRGKGSLTIERLGLINGGSDSTPFIQSTLTSLFVRDCSFRGSGAGGAASATDAIVLGGTTTNIDGSATSAFQGYGTVIERNYFSRIQRGVYGRTWVNAIQIKDNTWSATCGGLTALEIDGTVGFAFGNVIDGNTVELTNYTYGFTFTNSPSNYGHGNTFWDQTSTTTAAYRLVGNSLHNSCQGCSLPSAPKDVSDSLGVGFQWTDGDQVWGKFELKGGHHGAIIRPEPAPAAGDNAVLIEAHRSTGDSADPNAVLWQVTQGGNLSLYSNSTGHAAVTLFDADGATLQMDADSIVRNGAGNSLSLYAGDANSLVIIGRGLMQQSPLETGARPAAGIGAGACYFDTLTKRLTCSDGVAWHDALNLDNLSTLSGNGVSINSTGGAWPNLQFKNGSTVTAEIETGATGGEMDIAVGGTNSGYTHTIVQIKPGDSTQIVQGGFVVSSLAGTGNAFACLDTNGRLYRSATACAP